MSSSLRRSDPLLAPKLILVFVCGVALGLIVLPLIPGLMYFLAPTRFSETPNYPVIYEKDQNNGAITNPSNLKTANNVEANKTYVTNGNRLYIPKIGIDTKILEGSSLDVLLHEEGVWREPDSSTPESIGNMVLAGHRFQYLPPNTTTFYNLDKLQLGDKIQVYWKGKQHKFEVYKTFEVGPNEGWVKTTDPELSEITLYTCTPLFTSEKRLIVKAREYE